MNVTWRNNSLAFEMRSALLTMSSHILYDNLGLALLNVVCWTSAVGTLSTICVYEVLVSIVDGESEVGEYRAYCMCCQRFWRLRWPLECPITWRADGTTVQLITVCMNVAAVCVCIGFSEEVLSINPCVCYGHPAFTISYSY